MCSPSRAALITGHSTARLNLTTFLPGRADRSSHRLPKQEINSAIPSGVKTLPELLKPAGRVTAAVDFIGRNARKPFLLFSHLPVATNPQRVAAHARAFNPINSAMVESLDEAVGLILNAPEKEGIARNTLVVFSSDDGGLHVPALNDAPPTHNTPFRAGKGFLYEGGLRVPLILRWPGRIERGEVTAPTVLGDLWPTLCALAKVPVPTVDDFQDLTPMLFTGAAPGVRALTWHQPHYMNQGASRGRSSRGRLEAFRALRRRQFRAL